MFGERKLREVGGCGRMLVCMVGSMHVSMVGSMYVFMVGSISVSMFVAPD